MMDERTRAAYSRMGVMPPGTPSNGLRRARRTLDIATLEKAGESLSRHGDLLNAVALWAIALRLRMEAEQDG